MPAFETWEPKQSTLELTEVQVQDIIALADKGHEDDDPYSSKINATKRWFGLSVAEYLNLELPKDKYKIKGVIAQLIKDKRLFEKEFKDKRRQVKWGVFTLEREND